MKIDLTYAYAADITKSERAADGSLIVYGKATGPDLDLDGDRCDPGWLKSAMPEWFEWGNIREMHGPVAAGVGLEMTEDGDSWYIKAKVVDPGAALKVEEGVYKGFSIGIKNGVRQVIDGQKWINKGIVAEVSLVDRPCNPDAKLEIAKSLTADDLTVLQPVEAADANSTTAVLSADMSQFADQIEKAKTLLKRLHSDEEGTAQDIAKGVLDMDKLEDHDDVDGAMEAVSVICRLIMSEANDLADGQLHEIYDLDTLMSALHGLKYFIACEEGQMDARNDVGYSDMDLWADSDILKRHFTAEQRRTLAAAGKAMPGGRFPIENSDDVHNAVKRLNTAKGSKSAIKQHIIKRARALGVSDMIPDGWMGKPKGNKTVEADIAKSAPMDTEAINEIVKAAVAEVTKASGERIEALETELARVKATPLPGGPVLLGMESDSQQMQSNERLEKQVRIDALRARAERVQGSAADDFYALAKKLEAEL